MQATVTSTITTVRAIGAEFARRAMRPLIITGSIIALLLLGLGGWLTTQSAWWWLLEVVFICSTLLFIVLAMSVAYILRHIRPALTKPQQRSVAGFVDKLERVAEHIQTPRLVILYRVVRDAIRPRQNGFIETVAHDSKTLASDFDRLRRELAE